MIFLFLKGTYAFIEVSGIPTGSRAQLISEIFPATKGNCLSFWYHMKGSGIGSLNFYLKTVSGTPYLTKSIEVSSSHFFVLLFYLHIKE